MKKEKNQTSIYLGMAGIVGLGLLLSGCGMGPEDLDGFDVGEAALRCTNCESGGDPPITSSPTPLPVCSAPLSRCGYTCVNLTNDPRNCGSCGNQCQGGCSAGVCEKFIYQGGRVISNADIIAVYLGTPTASFRASMDHFYAELQRDGRYLDWLSEYNTPSQTIGRGRFLGSYVIQPPGGGLDQAGIGAHLDHEIHYGRLPGTTANTVYMVHVAPSIRLVSGAVIFGSRVGAWPGDGWCAMHLEYISGSTGRGTTLPPIVYAILPNVPACGQSMAFQTYIASHELVEAITNPASVFFSLSFLSYTVGQGPWAWVIPKESSFLNPKEIADVCEGQYRQLRTSPAPGDVFTVSAVYSNRRASCYSP